MEKNAATCVGNVKPNALVVDMPAFAHVPLIGTVGKRVCRAIPAMDGDRMETAAMMMMMNRIQNFSDSEGHR